MQPTPRSAAPDDDERVPVFGTWPAIYTAVIATAITVMGLIAVFTNWPW